ncbi:glyoxalase/bleomycin resistance protein/dioxygenase superfamily protein [Mongoliibacter ruber]|uniref:Glyoxalase/bleomycin resistance protein/dioxygenase superfamily protein n=2 Tax=Mongoliibacter ruber TaxID=1750599 RepID=A0A2T0WTE9_9BACT|nr:glyoxalase/bleomycin resistance protein/dioxygenase superfamily protein [Mongoliibacter ruber]
MPQHCQTLRFFYLYLFLPVLGSPYNFEKSIPFMKSKLQYLLLLIFCFACGNEDTSIQLGKIEAFAEMVSADLKHLALSEPMPSKDVDKLWSEAQLIAEKYGVQVYREVELIKTSLFPSDISYGKEVLIFHKENGLRSYLDLKENFKNYDEEDAARRFGRLLGYPVHYINSLLAKNTAFRTLPDFGIQATNIFLYYEDLPAAQKFYQELLGMEVVSDYEFAKTLRVSEDSFITLVDAAVGRHKLDEPKTVAIALLTDQLPEWYAYLQESQVPIKYEYKPKENNAHDGFVAVDPEGYLLEFETFKQHPENEKLMPQIQKFSALPTVSDDVAAGLGFYGAVTWLYYEDLQEAELFYEEKIGLPLIVDQGWAKVYQASQTGYIGLVDERRGMHNFTEKKGASVAFIVEDLEGWYNYVQQHSPLPLEREMYVGNEERYKAFVGLDPGKYFLEFNSYLEHSDNKRLFEILESNK